MRYRNTNDEYLGTKDDDENIFVLKKENRIVQFPRRYCEQLYRVNVVSEIAK